jgi:rhomboid protease GluP
LVITSAQARRWQSILVPLGAGVSMLALFGAGEHRVDIGAHACGFAAGCLLAAALRVPASR